MSIHAHERAAKLAIENERLKDLLAWIDTQISTYGRLVGMESQVYDEFKRRLKEARGE